MTDWFIDSGSEFGSRRFTSKDGYEVQEEKIGDLDDPEYTSLRVEDEETGEVVSGAIYKLEDSGWDEVEVDDGGTDFDYNGPLDLLNSPEGGRDEGIESAKELEGSYPARGGL
jgi:hypothetical protein